MLRRLPKQIASAIRKNAEGAGNSHVRLRSYDVMGRMVEEVASLGRVRRWSYDPNGNPTEYTDADGSVYRYHYASWNLLSRAIDPMGHTVSYQYSHREQLRGVWDARGVRTEYEYDLKDRLVKASRNGVVREEYRYDLGDNLIEKVTGDGKNLLTFEIGEPGLKSVRRLASGEKHSFEYSESGRFLRAATDQAEVLFDYGPQDQMLRDERDGRGVSHVYADGKLAKTVYFGKFTTKYRA
jgi:YD repeat-containing protein